MIQLSYLSTARFSGPDACAFLHAQLSADIEALEDGDSTFACYCTPRGQVLGLLLVGKHEETYLMTASSELLPGIMQRLQMFLLRSSVNMELAAGLTVSGLWPQETTPGVAEGVEVVFSPGTLPLRYAIGPANTSSGESFNHWRFGEISHGVSWLGPGTSEKFIPQMLGFENFGAVNFSKGCYPGQEIVARTRYLGKVKRKPLIASVVGQVDIGAGSQVQLDYEEEAVGGILLDSAPAGNHNTLMFIVTRGKDDATPSSITFEDQSYPVVEL